MHAVSLALKLTNIVFVNSFRLKIAVIDEPNNVDQRKPKSEVQSVKSGAEAHGSSEKRP